MSIFSCKSTQKVVSYTLENFIDAKIRNREEALLLELVSKELNHFWVIADLFRQIGVIVVDLCYFALFEDFSLQK